MQLSQLIENLACSKPWVCQHYINWAWGTGRSRRLSLETCILPQLPATKSIRATHTHVKLNYPDFRAHAELGPSPLVRNLPGL